ncbi:Peptidase C1A papain C-terminal [Arabidopsis suecica]|uniref:Peptidase C1A papain C-terminal n=1 Tax=Arabidopsis suecica TaxID=45249 RepID=A0A8T2H0L1_ARASU|nr:Peptidase C1A papain C-terminal [Arabidopsis suecica]
MGKNEPTIGGKPKTQKIPNELKLQAASARKKGTSITPQIDENEFGDNSSLSRDWRTVATILGIVVAQKREICWALALARLLQAVYNVNLEDKKSYLEFMHEDLLQHLKPKEVTSKVASLELKNIKKAVAHIRVDGLLTVSSTAGSNKAGGSGHHEKWDFSIEENATAEFIREKLDFSPVAISFHVADNEFQAIGKGIYKVRILKAEDGKKVSSHMVLVVGYGYTKDDHKLFFLIQNSWGKLWGVNGYGRIFIDQNSGATAIYP